MDRFSFGSLPLGRARPPAPAPAPDAIEIFPLTIASGVSAGERSGGELQALLDGDYSTVEHVDNELRWQAIGGCPVPFRGSVMRVRSIIFEHQPPLHATLPTLMGALSCRPRQVVLFKLLGTGIFAAITAVGSDDPLTTKSCALCAAINTVAIVHYFFSSALGSDVGPAPHGPGGARGLRGRILTQHRRGLTKAACACAVWRIRLQTLNIIPMARWMVRLGRYRNANNTRKRARGDTAVFESEDFKQQVFQNSKKTYVQEIAVDSLRCASHKPKSFNWSSPSCRARRHSDWTVTLVPAYPAYPAYPACANAQPEHSWQVLMKIDEHSIAAGAQPAHEPFLAPHTAAFLQTAIVGLGSVARFFLNDLRVSEAQRGKPRVLSIALGVLSYLGATAIWVLTTANLLYQVGWPSEKTTYPAREDSEVLWALAIVQSGYALMSLVQILWLNFAATDLEPGAGYGKKAMPPGQMDPALSVVKDIVYGVLDSVTKGGLALFCALRATRSVV